MMQVNTDDHDYDSDMEVMMLSIACRSQSGELKGIERALSWVLFDFLLNEYIDGRYEYVD